jgi:hypothetical protein
MDKDLRKNKPTFNHLWDELIKREKYNSISSTDLLSALEKLKKVANWNRRTGGTQGAKLNFGEVDALEKFLSDNVIGQSSATGGAAGNHQKSP